MTAWQIKYYHIINYYENASNRTIYIAKPDHLRTFRRQIGTKRHFKNALKFTMHSQTFL